MISASTPPDRPDTTPAADGVGSTPASRSGAPATTRLAGSPEGLSEVTGLVARTVGSSLTGGRPDSPLPPGAPADVLAAARASLGPARLPQRGIGSEPALRRLARILSELGLDLTHPHAAAHLQPPPLAVAVAADALASAGNASLDTYDSGPATLAVEHWVIEVLTGMAGFPPGAAGVLTPGGSMSNLLALLLARDAVATRLGANPRCDGIAALPRLVVLASEIGHFSIQRACATLGLGESAVHCVPVDSDRRMRPESLAVALRELPPEVTPVAVVATAGSTDFGTVDPLPELAAVAAEYGVWLHVDAAYGFGALFSDRLAALLNGVALADSVTVDLHKIGWQPAAASALLLRDGGRFAPLERQVAYLNPADDTAAGYDGLLGHSLQTTRRADAVKIAATLLAHGRDGLGDMLDTCHDLAVHAQRRIEADPKLELIAPAQLTTVVFRCRATNPDQLNARLRRRLLRAGSALVGRTEVNFDGHRAVCLKLTLINPATTPSDIDSLLNLVVETGHQIGEITP